jgi:hypothetical protein
MTSIVESPVEAVFEFVAKRSPLTLIKHTLSVNDSNRGIGCPDVANPVNVSGEPVGFRGRAVSQTFIESVRRLIRYPVPLDLYIVGRGTPGQKKKDEVTHKPILVQLFGMYNCA